MSMGLTKFKEIFSLIMIVCRQEKVRCARKRSTTWLWSPHHSGLMATNTPSAARPSLTNLLHSLTYRISDSTFLSTTPFKGADRFPGSSSVLKTANRYRWSCTTHIALLICSSNSSTSLSKLLSTPPTPGIGKDASFHRAVPARFRIFPMAVI